MLNVGLRTKEVSVLSELSDLNKHSDAKKEALRSNFLEIAGCSR